MRLTTSYRDKLSNIGISLKHLRKSKKYLKEIQIFDILGNRYKALEYKNFYKKIKIVFYKNSTGKSRIALVRNKRIIIDDLLYVTPLCDGLAVAMQLIANTIYVIAVDKNAGKVFTIGRRKDYMKEIRKKNKK